MRARGFARLAAVTAMWMSPLPGLAQTAAMEQGVGGYTGTDDTTLYQNRVDNSNGGFGFVFAGVTQDASPRRALVRFDLSAIPATAVIQSVELRLSVDRSRPGTETHTLHRVTAAWGEGAVNSGEPGGLGAAATAGDATWNARLFGSASWATPGGDFAPTTSAVTVVDIEGTTATFTGAAMILDVQAWADGTVANHGWILRGNEVGVHNAKRFHSSEGVPGLRPRLTVTYTDPAAVRGWEAYE